MTWYRPMFWWVGCERREIMPGALQYLVDLACDHHMEPN